MERTIRTLAGFTLAVAAASLAAEQPRLPAAGPEALRYPISDGLLRLEGSNAVHDWFVVGREVKGFLEVGADFPGQPGKAVNDGEVKVRCEVSIPVNSLKSIEKDGRPYSSKFDEVMYGRLEGEKYPTIQFRLEKLTRTGVQEGSYVFDSSGELVVRGVTNIVHMPVKAVPLPGGRLKVSGVANLKQKDFKILPGVVCFTVPRDDVRVIFEVTLEKEGSHGPN